MLGFIWTRVELGIGLDSWLTMVFSCHRERISCMIMITNDTDDISRWSYRRFLMPTSQQMATCSSLGGPAHHSWLHPTSGHERNSRAEHESWHGHCPEVLGTSAWIMMRVRVCRQQWQSLSAPSHLIMSPLYTGWPQKKFQTTIRMIRIIKVGTHLKRAVHISFWHMVIHVLGLD